MLIKKLKSISRKTKVKKINFTKDKLYEYNLISKGDMCDKFFGFLKSDIKLPTELKSKRLFYVKNKLYAYCSNYYLYVYNGSNFEIAVSDTFLAEPLVYEIICNGLRKTLVLYSDRLYILGDKTSDEKKLKLSQQTTLIKKVVFNRIFSAQNRTVYFTQPLDDALSKTTLDFSILLEAPEHMGSVTDFGYINDTLYVFCQKGILKVDKFYDENNILCTPLCIPGLKISNRSVQSIENFIFFFSRGKLYKMSSDKITELDVFKHIIGTLAVGLPGNNNEFLIYPLAAQSFGFRCALIYNSITDEYFYTSCKANLSYSNGYCIDESNNQVYILENNGFDSKLQSVWTSEVMYFDTLKPKTLLKFELKTSYKCLVTITGDFGEKQFNLVLGNNIVRCNLTSTKFQINVTSSPNALPISGFKLEYTIKGE